MSVEFDKEILVIGDVVLDVYIDGVVARINPEAPVPIIQVDPASAVKTVPGCAGNTACNIQALGGKAKLLSLVGKDMESEIMEEKLKEVGVVPLFIKTDKAMIVKERYMAQSQQVIRIDCENTHPYFSESYDLLYECVKDELESADAILISDYRKRTLRNNLIRMIINTAEVPIVIDSKRKEWSIFANATMAVPNETEAGILFGAEITDDNIIEASKRLLIQLKMQALLITRGEKGMALSFYPDTESFLQRDAIEVQRIPALAHEVYDVTGAGDTVAAVCALGLAEGMEWAKITSVANIAASLVVGKIGTATVNLDELQKIF